MNFARVRCGHDVNCKMVHSYAQNIKDTPTETRFSREGCLKVKKMIPALGGNREDYGNQLAVVGLPPWPCFKISRRVSDTQSNSAHVRSNTTCREELNASSYITSNNDPPRLYRSRCTDK